MTAVPVPARRAAASRLFLLVFAGLALCLSGCLPSVYSLKHGGAGVAAPAAGDISPEDEFYLGRAVAARMLAASAPLRDDRATAYVNRLGRALGLFAPGGSPYNGYTVILLDTAEASSRALPGGFIVVTRGMLGRVAGESELAALLAHEIAHAANRDPLAGLTSHTVERAVSLARERAAGGGSARESAEVFAEAVDEIHAGVTGPGNGEKAEREAAAAAAAILARAGYDPAAARALATRLKADAGRETHPAPAALAPGGPESGAAVAETPERSRRFAAALGAYARKGP